MSFETTPLTPRFGVEVHDADLGNVSDADFIEIRALFEEHSVLLFRDQKVDDAAHIALANRFGPIEDRLADERPKDEAFKVPEVSNVTEKGTTTGEMDLHTLNLKANMLWHADSTFLPVPALTNILIGRIVTKSQGETQLASTRAGWADMPAEMQEKLRNAVVHHRYSHSRARISPELAALPMFQKWSDQQWRAVWTNPVNGREALYLASHAFAIDGLDVGEATELIDAAIAWTTQDQYVYSHAWRENDVLIWDQRAVLHRATPWNYKEPRKLSSICVSATTYDGVDGMRPMR